MSKGLKIFLIVVLICSALVDALWLTIYFVAPDKVVIKSFNLDGLVGTEDKDGNKIPIVEVNVFDNCLETKFNYFCNSESSETYSAGVQQVFINNEDLQNDEFFEEKQITDRSLLGLFRKNIYHKYCLEDNVYFYNSDGDIAYRATNSIQEKEGFYISVGEDRYFMTFKNEYFLFETQNRPIGSPQRKYMYNDINFFLVKLYRAVLSMDNISSGRVTFEFGDLFNYYKETSPGVFENDPVSEQENKKILSQVISYYNIKVNVHKGNILRAEQSLFSQVGYSSNYYVGDIKSTDYYFGKTNYVLTEKDFNYKYVENGSYELFIKQSALEYVKTLSNTQIIIKIDLDNLKSNGIIFNKLNKEALNDIQVFKVYTLQKVNGEIVETEVNYAN